MSSGKKKGKADTKSVHVLDEVRPANFAVDPAKRRCRTCSQVLVSENGQVRKGSLNMDWQSHLKALYGQEKGQMPSVTANLQQQVWPEGTPHCS